MTKFMFTTVGLSVEKRATALLSQLTLDEKIAQLCHDAPAIERLGIPPYNWWNECLHGVGRAGIATVFPQAIGLAATWNDKLLGQIGQVISAEARAKHHQAYRAGEYSSYQGLTFWSPNINIFRDPRWGRGQETYGEDPYLTSRMAVAFIKGLQGDDPDKLVVAACAKHFAVHSGPEADRHRFDAVVSQKDLYETYLPAFKAAVVEAQVEGIMSAYNRTNGEPCVASPTLMQTILRDEWGFTGHVVSDCAGIVDLYDGHNVVADMVEAAALAVREGCDLNCGEAYQHLQAAVERGLVSVAEIDRNLQRLLTTRIKLGLFDPEHIEKDQLYPIELVDHPDHRALALQASRQSIVLLKNTDELLPLSPSVRKLAVIGPNADDVEVLLGNYNGTPSAATTVLAGIRQIAPRGCAVTYTQGCLVGGEDQSGFAEAMRVADSAEIIIFVGGLSQWLEGEEGEHVSVPKGERKQDDRPDIDMPPIQAALLRQLYTLGKPIVLVLLNGSALALNWADAHLPAILTAWYAGQDGGLAVAEVLFGRINPAGRLPITFYKSLDDLPPFNEYAMQNRTYRYFSGEPLYPFGYGLSYTRFSYTLDGMQVSDDMVRLDIAVANVGARDGDEVVQVYAVWDAAEKDTPLGQLVAFERLTIPASATTHCSISFPKTRLYVVDEEGELVRPSHYPVWLSVGGGQPRFSDSFMVSVRGEDF